MVLFLYAMPKRRTKTKRRKSAKRVRRAKKLARTLPRDRQGKFLPRGSKNLFKRKRARSAPARVKVPKRRKATTTALSPRRSPMPRRSAKDQYPNFLSGTIRQTSSDAFTTTQIFTPIPRLKTIGNRATVMELLWMDIKSGIDLILLNTQWDFQLSIGTKPAGIIGWQDPRVFVNVGAHSNIVLAGGSGRGISTTQLMYRYDFQSNDGFGFLLASDAFHQSIDSFNTNTINGIEWKLFYRFVDIPLAEFVGIVQSTQQS